MNENFKAWLNELRTTDKAQGRGQLRNERNEFCCLGIACEVSGLNEAVLVTANGGRYSYDSACGVLPSNVVEWLGTSSSNPNIDWPKALIDTDISMQSPDGVYYDLDLDSVAELNDRGDFTFAQIADVIEYFGLRD